MKDTITDMRPRVFFIEQSVVEEYDLTPYDGWLYVVIVSHANKNTREGFPGLTRLAKLAKMSRRKVIECIDNLEKKGLIHVDRTTVETEAGKKQNTVNHYKVMQATKPDSKNWVEKQGVVHEVHHPSAPESLGVVHEVHPNNIDSNNDSAPKSAAPLAVVSTKRAKAAPKPKPYADVEAKAIDGVISAWIRQIPKPPATNQFAHDTNRTIAAALIRSGYTADDVSRFVSAQYRLPFWQGKFLGLRYVGDNLPSWIASNPVKSAAPQSMSDFSKWRLEEMGEVIPDAS